MAVGGHQEELTLSITRNGQRTQRWFCDVRRFSRPTLLRLLCTESSCPEARDVQTCCRALGGLPPPTAPRRAATKPGWDLFKDGVCSGGGTHIDPATGATLPRIATPDEAPRWLLNHQPLALQAMPSAPHAQGR